MCIAGDIQDTAILSTVDADMSHIPSLHNTDTDYAEAPSTEAVARSDSKDTEGQDVWLDPIQDIFNTATNQLRKPQIALI